MLRLPAKTQTETRRRKGGGRFMGGSLAGEHVLVETAGAGGYGRPGERERDMIDPDRRSGKFSPEYLDRHYPR